MSNLEKDHHGRPFWMIPPDAVLTLHGGVGWWAKLSKAEQAVYPVLLILSDGQHSDARQRSIARYAGLCESSIRPALRLLEKAGHIKRMRIPLARRRFRYRYTVGSAQEGGLMVNYGTFDNVIMTSGTWAGLSSSAKAAYIVLLVAAGRKSMDVVNMPNAWMEDAQLCNTLFGSMTNSIVDVNTRTFHWGTFMAMPWDDATKARFKPHLVMARPLCRRVRTFGLMWVAKHARIDSKSARKALRELEAKRLCLVFLLQRGQECSFFLPPPRFFWDKPLK